MQDHRVQQNIDAQIKKNPGQIIGLTECEKATQDLLNAPAVAETTFGTTLSGRQSYQNTTLRDDEDSSVLVGVRSAVAERIERLLWERRDEGEYRVRKQKRARAYTRTLIANVKLRFNVGYFGKELRVAVCHLHYKVANKIPGFCRNNDKFWRRLADQMKQYHVHILMGDFNMSLFKVVPERRSRGVPASLVS